jgi:hypothetical protein
MVGPITEISRKETAILGWSRLSEPKIAVRNEEQIAKGTERNRTNSAVANPEMQFARYAQLESLFSSDLILFPQLSPF